jgi:hypothetical protein
VPRCHSPGFSALRGSSHKDCFDLAVEACNMQKWPFENVADNFVDKWVGFGVEYTGMKYLDRCN